ncbi:hypothetical protein [Streptomyces sp. NBC_01262]|uniref:hypothetical protein n=1 Tax=Streptomyces sp. NBC_01262 TaxID=2903803 RepID=UPI002E3733E2|nr:hypothetical protein [Streptomyces sp. NBC_01262]
MPQPTTCPICPSRAEPLEPDDTFCGVCGAELTPPAHRPGRARALDGGGHDSVTVAILPFPAPAGRAEHEPA